MKRTIKNYPQDPDTWLEPERTPAGVQAILDKHSPPRPAMAKFITQRYQLYELVYPTLQAVTNYVEALIRVKNDLDTLKVPQAEVKFRNIYKEMTNKKIDYWQKELTSVTRLYEALTGRSRG